MGPRCVHEPCQDRPGAEKRVSARRPAGGEAAAIIRVVSKHNLDFVLEAYARYNAGERLPELDFWHEDAEYHTSPADPDSAVHLGIEAIRRQFASWEEAYPDLKVEPLEAKEGGDHVFVWVRFVGHGASSGLPIEMELAHVYTLRDGRAVRVVEYLDRGEALAAAGLAEQEARSAS